MRLSSGKMYLWYFKGRELIYEKQIPVKSRTLFQEAGVSFLPLWANLQEIAVLADRFVLGDIERVFFGKVLLRVG